MKYRSKDNNAALKYACNHVFAKQFPFQKTKVTRGWRPTTEECDAAKDVIETIDTDP